MIGSERQLSVMALLAAGGGAQFIGQLCLVNQATTKMWRGEASKMPKFEREIKIKQPPDEYPFLQASL